MLRIGFLHTIIRPEEKMLLAAIRDRAGVEACAIDVRKLIFRLGSDRHDVDVVLERCINHSRALHALMLYECGGVACVNTSDVAMICGDKLQTSAALLRHVMTLRMSRDMYGPSLSYPIERSLL